VLKKKVKYVLSPSVKHIFHGTVLYENISFSVTGLFCAEFSSKSTKTSSIEQTIIYEFTPSFSLWYFLFLCVLYPTKITLAFRHHASYI